MPRRYRATIVRPMQLLAAVALSVACGAALYTTESAADELPRITVTSVRRAFHNGEHNAFTDLCRFNGRYYLTFRSCPDGHGVFPTAAVLVLESDDGQEWRQVQRFSVPGRDTRDPHF